MNYGKENVAYDFSRFEPHDNTVRKPEEPVKKEPGVKKARKAHKAVNARLHPLVFLKWAVICMFFTFSLAGIMICNVQINELDQAVTQAEKQVASSKSQEISLNMELESRMSLQNVENYAVNKLGYDKLDPYQVEYVHLTDSDKVVLSSNSGNAITTLFDNLFQRVKEYLG